MRSLMLLKLMIDLFFYGSIFIFVLVGYLNSEAESSFLTAVLGLGLNTLHGHEYFNGNSANIDPFSFSTLTLLILAMIRVVTFFVVIFHVKQMVGRFIKGDLFSEKVSRNLRIIGYGIIIYVILEIVIEALPAFLDNRIGTTMSGVFSGFNSGWFQFTLGLLFLFMDKVFRNAKALQQENDLTI